MNATVMTWSRCRIEVDTTWITEHAGRMFLAQAADGVWVPQCDIQQYESGQRLWNDLDGAISLQPQGPTTMDHRTINNAVQRSREFNELVRCTVTDGSRLEAFIAQVAGDDYGLSPENRDEYGREVLDVYGDDWRIQVTVDAEGTAE